MTAELVQKEQKRARGHGSQGHPPPGFRRQLMNVSARAPTSWLISMQNSPALRYSHRPTPAGSSQPRERRVSADLTLEGAGVPGVHTVVLPPWSPGPGSPGQQVCFGLMAAELYPEAK